MESPQMVGLSDEEVRSLYKLLVARDPGDEVLARLLTRIEARLYGTLTIEQIEALRSAGAGSGGGARAGQGHG
jgi:hypothetical protein